MTDASADWGEQNTVTFAAYGDIITPSRPEQLELVAALVPADRDDRFTAVDLACGTGSMSEVLLKRFPQCRLLALDGSPSMLAEARQRLAPCRDRVELGEFDLRRRDWLHRVPENVRCFVSSLAIHHLDGAEKQSLFRDLAERLPPGGALLIVDLVDPVNDRAWTAYGDAWDAVVREQSLQATGILQAYERFRDGWNHYRDPDLEFDKPSRLFDQLQWLADAGFAHVDCFWLRAGHAIYGGYR
ncbi:MAG TPA: class I SAM-dependent methyltransferase [Chloroflexota bacterium]